MDATSDQTPSGPNLLTASRVELLTRRGKIAALQTRRLLGWALAREAYPVPALAPATLELPHLLYAARVPIAREDADAHPVFEAGKRHNVALAAPAFNGLLLSPEQPFSFWRALGRVTEAKGYRHGMELKGGCIVPAIGGGICLISNALYELAVRAGFDILERYGHTMEAVPPSGDGPWGLDATVFWPHVDLRFAPRRGKARLSVRVVGDALEVAVRAEHPPEGRVELREEDDRVTEGPPERIRENRIVRRIVDARGSLVREDVVAINRKRLMHSAARRRNCLTCGEEACHARVQVPHAG